MELLSSPSIVGVLIFLTLLALNFPIFAAVGLGALATLVFYQVAPLSVASYVFAGSLDSFPLLATPLFIIAGAFLTKTGIATRLVRLAELMVGNLPGGLPLTVLVTGAILGSMSGSNLATVAALSFLIQPMAERGYPRPFAVAVVAAGCTFGVVIPPSINLIIYGVITEESIPKLFAAGVGPGLLMLLTLGGYVVAASKIKGYKRGGEERSWASISHAFREAFWGLLAPVVILGGIYSGLFTATEAAAVAVVYMFLVDRFVYKAIPWKALPRVMFESGRTIGVVVFIISTAAVFGWIMQTQGLASMMNSAVMSATDGKPALILLAFNAIFVGAGMFLEPLAAIYLLVPLFKPTLDAIGYDLIQFGAMMTVNLSMAHLTPPVGVGLFLASQLGGVPFTQAVRAAIPFILCEMIVILMVTFIPGISLWLPSLM